MKRKIILIILIWIFFILQTTVFRFLQIASTSPNLLLILTVSFGFMQGKKQGLFTGFCCGILIDLFYGSILGYYALIYMFIGYFCGYFCDIYFDRDLRMPLILVSVSDFLCGTVIYVTRFLFRGRTDYGGYICSVILPELIYTVILTFILYRLLYLINRKLSAKEKRVTKNPWLRS